MVYETWKLLFLISAALTLLFLPVTVILAVKFRFFSLLKFKAENSDNYIRTLSDNSAQPSSEELFSKTENLIKPSEYTGLEIYKENEAFSGTVVVPDSSEISGTVVITDEFRITGNTVIIHADPSVIRKVTDIK